MLLYNLCVSFSINGSFTNMQVTHDAMPTNVHSPFPAQMLTFDLCSYNKPKVPFPFTLDWISAMSVISQKNEMAMMSLQYNVCFSMQGL